jgi:3alpha(or 20beta)-hydroxysteroid dehydrogenase
MKAGAYRTYPMWDDPRLVGQPSFEGGDRASLISPTGCSELIPPGGPVLRGALASAVNATGTLLGMHAAIPAMRAVAAGSIINVASIFGVTGSEGYVAYTASKAAIIAMTKTAALEHAADGIRVNAICPGGVSTPMNENEPGGGVVPLTPLDRRAHVNEISGAIAYLASDDASFVTGTELVIDGGYLAR